MPQSPIKKEPDAKDALAYKCPKGHLFLVNDPEPEPPDKTSEIGS